MVKKLRFMLLLLLGIMSPFTSLADITDRDGIYYFIDTNTGSATVISGPSKYTGSIRIPSSFYVYRDQYTVKKIEKDAFANCPSLTYVSIPNTVTTIGEGAFKHCTSLSSIYIPNSVKSIGDFAFYECRKLSSVTIPNYVTSIGEWTFSGCTSLSSITIPNSVKNIGANAFYGCSSLSSVTIPNSVTSIGNGAFGSCSSLTSITIPESVTSIGSASFAGCRSVSSITVDPQNTIYDSREDCNAIIKKYGNTLIAGCKSTVIPNSVTCIGDCSFESSSLSTITIPNSVTSIGNRAFWCSSLGSITIPNSVTSIGESAFSSSSLNSITMRGSVESIGAEAFRECRYLRTVVCEALTPPTCGSDVFIYASTSSATLYVPELSVYAYKNTSPWSSFGTFETIATPTPPERTITISDLGTATYCCEYDLDFRGIEGIKAYVATGYNYNSGSVLLTRVHEIPSGTGFMVMGVAGSHEIPTAEVKYAYANLFVGTTAETALPGSDGGYSNYILANGTEGLKFYRSDGTSPLLANRAYLHIPTNITSDSRTLSFSFAEDSEVTGIDDVVDSGSDVQAHTYNLSGQRVVSTKSGVYVKNGKIVIIK